ncbi:MAG: diacylglycerol kinase family lipid kinase [Bacteroidales bacterium]|nr:diacylglycerol kinase family lipid kinase [Bacteroidales bacterium]
MKKVAIIANRKRKKALKLKDQLIKLLPEDYIVIDKHTDSQGHAIDLTLEAIQENADFIIAAGGDGTINEVVNGVMRATEEQRQKIIVGLFPLGTGNDFARTSKMAKSVKELSAHIVNGVHKNIDLGLVEYYDNEGVKQNRYFDNIAEIGVGAKTVEIVNKSSKTLGGTLTFFLGVLRAFLGYKRQSVRIKTNDFQWVGKIVAVCVANGQYFGSGLGIAPGARLDDGQLSLVVIGNIRIIHFLWYLPKLRKLQKIIHPEVHYHKIDTCEIFSEVKYPVEMDGENIGFTPFSAKVVPNAIKILIN